MLVKELLSVIGAQGENWIDARDFDEGVVVRSIIYIFYFITINTYK